MPTLHYPDLVVEVAPSESVLDTLLRAGVSVPHACKAGSCGACMLRATEGVVPERARRGLKDAWKARGYFLACVCHPETDLSITPIDDDVRVPARISALDRLSADVVRVRLVCEDPFEFHAGQFIALIRADGLARSYSIASLPEEGELELHIRCLPDGRMSQWVLEHARVGDRVAVQGPAGDCFYVPGRPEQPLLLVGTGTGLAPLYGIVRDAIRREHRGPIHLYHGAVRLEGLYLRETLERLAATHPQIEYVPTVLERDGPLERVLLERLPKLDGWRAFLCGDPRLVATLRKQLFLRGMDLPDINADAFLPAA
jgi:CDP-4-dehydro-6-deoxyglucose reductase, E3